MAMFVKFITLDMNDLYPIEEINNFTLKEHLNCAKDIVGGVEDFD
jgi:hypothetical protein